MWDTAKKFTRNVEEFAKSDLAHNLVDYIDNEIV
jgi:hypothetical protein